MNIYASHDRILHLQVSNGFELLENHDYIRFYIDDVRSRYAQYQLRRVWYTCEAKTTIRTT